MNSRIFFTKTSIITIYLLLVTVIIAKAIDPLFTVVLLTWLSIVLYALLNIEKCITLLTFFITFFTFLLGRETFYHFGNVGKYWVFHDKMVNTHTYLALILSMISLFLGYLFRNSFIKIKVYPASVLVNSSSSYRETLRFVTKYAYLFTYIFLLLAAFFQIRYVQRVGYIESYQATDSGAGVPWLVSKLSLFSPVLLYLFLATKPPKTEARLPIRLYLCYGLLTLLTGQRFPMMSIVLLITIYYVIRNQEESWIEKRHLISLIVLGPLAVVGLFLVDSIRLNRSLEYTGIFETFLDFFRVQGGSINVIKYSYHFRDSLTDVRLYGVNSIINNILNLNPYHGNSIEHALYGNSLAARMSYLIYGKAAYLNGRGVGSSFIAELFHDFGYIGIAIGSFVYGTVLKKISQMTFKSIWKTGVQIAMIPPLLLSPRGEFDGFIGLPFRRGNVFIVIVVILVTHLLHKRYRRINISKKVGINENKVGI